MLRSCFGGKPVPFLRPDPGGETARQSSFLGPNCTVSVDRNPPSNTEPFASIAWSVPEVGHSRSLLGACHNRRSCSGSAHCVSRRDQGDPWAPCSTRNRESTDRGYGERPA